MPVYAALTAFFCVPLMAAGTPRPFKSAALRPAPVAQVPRGTLYHGTSMSDLTAVVRLSRGALSPGLSYFASAAHQSEPYARARAAKLGSEPVVLEFAPAAEALVAYSGRVAGQYPAYRAREAVPLTLLTEASKRAVWQKALRAAEFLPPAEARETLESFRIALGLADAALPAFPDYDAEPARLVDAAFADAGAYGAVSRNIAERLNDGVGASRAEVLARLGPAFVPYLEGRARLLGFSSPRALAGWALSAAGAAERKRLAAQAGLLSGHYGESYSSFFRDEALWRAGLDVYLDDLIARRAAAGRRELRARSLGAGYGQEPYTLALVIHAALARAGEDPAAWKVEIEAYDVGAVSLWAAAEGRFPEGSLRAVPEALRAALDALMPAEGARLRRAAPLLRSWIAPLFADLNDPEQHAFLERTPADIVFANHVLIHLAREASFRLADRLLGGSWTSAGGRGFLSLSEILVTEVFAETPARPRLRLLPADPVQVLAGAMGGSLYHKTVVDFHERLSHGLGRTSARLETALGALAAAPRWLSLGALRAWREIPREALSLRARFGREPSRQERVSREILDFALERLTAPYGLELGLLADARPYALDARARRLDLNVAWLLEDSPLTVAARLKLLARLEERLAARLPRAVRLPAPASAPAAFGFTPDGAGLRVKRGPAQDLLVWLDAARYKPSYGLRAL